ncbi:glycolate oxidase subunit GlcE [Oricola cellulosilytica]|uniref:Glycolate oxidase subunit GlcE n=1 Tax=Oricola cellulosilytica TaxID=1429082 RepID=A0A4R0PHY6_9HYPH|nr:glycolate oxidase subunit GlcE [Oricola cellulosilytica]TCD16618.1 glycolate oxidase subunit GlcE [Oricola cellulosilytica]
MASEETLRPTSEEEASEIVRQAAAGGRTLEIVGGGTKRGIGQPSRADRQLSTAGLTGITEYNPGELVLTARAGTPVAEIEAALSSNNQVLAFQPGNWRALFGANGAPTIGAIAAANVSGSRRISAGAARDSLLGVRFINGRGEIIKNGGKVMKNVTGLDLVKLMAGSWGTLGLLTEVSFKVLPRAATEATLVVHGGTAKEAASLMATAMGTSADVSGASHLPEAIATRMPGMPFDGQSATVLRLEGFEDSVAARLERLRAALPPGSETSTLDTGQSASLWQSLSDVAPFAASNAPLWRISVAPVWGADVAAAIRRRLEGELWFDWQGGLVWLQLSGTPDDAGATIIRDAIAANGGGHATLMRADEAVRANLPVFQPLAPAVAALSERIRASMDPASVFNPGRMVFDGDRKAA